MKKQKTNLQCVNTIALSAAIGLVAAAGVPAFIVGFPAVSDAFKEAANQFTAPATTVSAKAAAPQAK